MKLIGSKLLMRIWEERIKRTAHQQIHLAVLTIVNTIYKYFGIQSNMAFFSSKQQNLMLPIMQEPLIKKIFFLSIISNLYQPSITIRIIIKINIFFHYKEES
jgi:hypothetical protein